MRMSCNGCRVLRKGCSENCGIRPCLQWIKSPEAQANATVFLAKFYGRAGLMNLINAGHEHLRPAIFRSLLYEACGRIVNPVYGSVGLLWSGSWQLCQAAVEAVLKGAPITPMVSDTAMTGHAPPLKAYDIRHVSKDLENSADNEGLRASKSRIRARKRSVAEKLGKGCCEKVELTRSASHDSSLSHQSELAVVGNSETKETGGMDSVATAERSICKPAEIGLELTLGLAEPVYRARHLVPVKKRRVGRHGTCEEKSDTCRVELRLGYESQVKN